jgi:hypothetical protein
MSLFAGIAEKYREGIGPRQMLDRCRPLNLAPAAKGLLMLVAGLMVAISVVMSNIVLQRPVQDQETHLRNLPTLYPTACQRPFCPM